MERRGGIRFAWQQPMRRGWGKCWATSKYAFPYRRRQLGFRVGWLHVWAEIEVERDEW